MTAQSPTVHIVFSFSAAKNLGDALGKVGRTDHVAAFPDNLSYGPINPPAAEIRAKWSEEELQHTYWAQLAPLIETFWTDALASGTRRVAWMSRQSTSEYSGFLEWLWRIGDGDLQIVDLTNAHIVSKGRDGQLRPPQPALPLALIPADTIVRSALWDLARPITLAERQSYQNLWQRLKAENAPLRVLKEGKLVSAPISYFDPLLLSCVTTEWRKAMRLVGDALGSLLDENCFQTTDIILCARIRALVQAG
jgi:hypothetical protein